MMNGKLKITGDLKRYEGKTRIRNFIAIFRNGKLDRTKKLEFNDIEGWGGYILPRRITDLSEVGIDQCSDCEHYFPDGLRSCDHCDEKFCCDCADEHREEITEEYDTGGCNF